MNDTNNKLMHKYVILLVVMLGLIVLCQILFPELWEEVVVKPRNYISQFSQLIFGIDQKTFPQKIIESLPDGKYEQMIIASSDIKFDSSKMFLHNYDYEDSNDFSHVFDSEKERKQERENARKYFKKQFGLSDFILDKFMFEITVNPEIKYKAYYEQYTKKYNRKMMDGGYVVHLPPFFMLTGKYGGKRGVLTFKGSTLAYGHYKILDDKDKLQYKILYTSSQPLQKDKRRDGDYSPIDYDIEILDAHDKEMIGLKGKAQGINRNVKITGDKKNHILIRNVMSFYGK